MHGRPTVKSLVYLLEVCGQGVEFAVYVFGTIAFFDENSEWILRTFQKKKKKKTSCSKMMSLLPGTYGGRSV